MQRWDCATSVSACTSKFTNLTRMGRFHDKPGRARTLSCSTTLIPRNRKPVYDRSSIPEKESGDAVWRVLSGFPNHGTLSRRSDCPPDSSGVQSAEVFSFPTKGCHFAPEANRFRVAETEALQLPHRG